MSVDVEKPLVLPIENGVVARFDDHDDADLGRTVAI